MPIDIKQISNLLEGNFFIPSYQRGYRWESKQVTDLLNDLNAFSRDEEKENWYCLQPIVVKEIVNNDSRIQTNNLCQGKTWYEVIDGQQRLTTISIILKSFQQIKGQDIGVPEIFYETRPDSNGFIGGLKYDSQNKGGILNNENPDFYCMSNAYKISYEWFDKKNKDANLNPAFLKNLKEYVNVIWQKIDNGMNPIDAFTRLNIGKIPLSASDLIKALFLQERNFNGDNVAKQQLASQWYEIEMRLMDDSFFCFLTKSMKAYAPSNRIALLFEDIVEEESLYDNNLKKSIGHDNYAIFRYYQNLFDQQNGNLQGIQKIWKDVYSRFEIFESWYNQYEWYNYVGVLSHIRKHIPLFKLIEIYNIAQQNRNTFTNQIKIYIRNGNRNIIFERDTQQFDLEYGKDSQDIKELLLLYNALLCIDKKEKFPFDKYAKEKWDLEHIDSTTQYIMKTRREQVEWMSIVHGDYTNHLSPALLGNMTTFINTNGNFDSLRNQIRVEIQEDGNSNLGNRIGNLVLLPARINRAYKNAPFYSKKMYIANNPMQLFIPLDTSNAFNKTIPNIPNGQSITPDNMRWHPNDISVREMAIIKKLNNHNL